MRNLGTIIVDKDIITKDCLGDIGFLLGYSTCSSISSIPVDVHRIAVVYEGYGGASETVGFAEGADLDEGKTIIVTASLSSTLFNTDTGEEDKLVEINIPATINDIPVYYNGTSVASVTGNISTPIVDSNCITTITIGKTYMAEGKIHCTTTLMLLITRDPAGYHISNLNTGYYIS